MVATLLALLFGGIIWIHHLATTEITAERAAGRDLWPRALEGCEGGPYAPARRWVGSYRGVQREVSPESAERLDDVRTSDREATGRSFARRPDILGGGLVEIQREAVAACNAVMPEGAIETSTRIIELFCERYPLPPNWAAGCSGGGGPSGE